MGANWYKFRKKGKKIMSVGPENISHRRKKLQLKNE